MTTCTSNHWNDGSDCCADCGIDQNGGPEMTTYKTRADLMAHPGFNGLAADSDGNPCVWENHYSCRTCTSEQIDWTNEWSCQCNDLCPNCDAETEPNESVWIGPVDVVLHSVWESLPEAGAMFEAEIPAPKRTNDDRANEARDLCRLMELLTGVDDLPAQIADAITHLRHLARKVGLDWGHIEGAAQRNFHAEVEDEAQSTSRIRGAER